jgi:hypothetical protein
MQSSAPRKEILDYISLNGFLYELFPLPVALLTAATFVELGWSFYLLLVLVFTGMSAVMRQMLDTIHRLQAQIDRLKLEQHISQAIASTPAQVNALCSLAYQLCIEIAPAAKFELGLYDDSGIQIDIHISASDEGKLPPMHIPITPQWEWLREQHGPLLVQEQAQLEELPFSLPPLDQVQPQQAMFIPLGAKEHDTDHPPIGSIVLLSSRPSAFTAQTLTLVSCVAKQIGVEIVKIQNPS